MVDVDKCKNWGTQEKTLKIHLQYYELQMFLLRKYVLGIGKKCNQIWTYSNHTKGGGSSATLTLWNYFPHNTEVLTVSTGSKGIREVPRRQIHLQLEST